MLKKGENLLAFHRACIRASNNEASTFDIDSQADVEYLPAISQALTLLQQRELRLLDSGAQASDGASISSEFSPSPSVESLLTNSAEEAKNMLDLEFPALGADAGLKDKEDSAGKVEASSAEMEMTVQVPLVNNNDVYFYQCDSGALVFLHPICMKALLTDASKRVESRGGESEAKTLPSLLSSFVVLEHESVRIDAQVRSRIPYLRNLPEHCDLVYLVEIDIASIVLPETYALFSDEIQKRRHRRKKAKHALNKEKRNDMDREIAQSVQREEMQERHKELMEKEARDLEALKSGPQAGKGSKEDDEWPSGGITAVVESHGEMHSYKNISTTMGYFPELGSSPPPPTAGVWTRPVGSRSSSFESQPDAVMKGGKKDKGKKMDLIFTFS